MPDIRLTLLPRARQFARYANEPVFRLQPQFCQQRQRGRISRYVKQRLHNGFVSARAHNIALRAPTQHKVYGIYQDGFARACFAREHIEARRKFHAQFIDQSHVFN